MARFDLRDFKKQASFFLREKLNDARLALTDVSRIQLLTEEATNEDSWGPETKTMAILADAAFELEEYERIVQVMHSRLEPNKKRHWRQLYKTLVVLEYLLLHGPNSLGREFRGDITCMEELSQFNFTDQQGIDRGPLVRKTADRILELLNNPDFRKEERTRVKKISVGIRGFGSNTNQECSQNAVEDVKHGSQHAPDEKSVAMYPQLAQDVSSSPLSEKRVLASPKGLEGKGQLKLFEKSLSSPSLFRERLPYLGRQSADDRKNELEGVKFCLLDAEEERESPSCDSLGEKGEPGGLMRWISEENTGEGITEDENMNKSSHDDAQSLFESIDTFSLGGNCKSSIQKYEGEQLFLNFPNCHNVSYPNHTTRFQHQWQPSSLIDCSSKFGEAA